MKFSTAESTTATMRARFGDIPRAEPRPPRRPNRINHPEPSVERRLWKTEGKTPTRADGPDTGEPTR